MKFYTAIKSIVNILFKFIYRIEIIGEENIQGDKNLIICSNHIHVFDPIILAIIYPRQIHFMAKKELFENKFLNFIFKNLGAFPVSRKESDLSAIKNALRVLKKNNILGVFPEGTRVKEFDLKNAKAGTALLSVKSKSPVLPIYIESTYKLFSKIKIYIGEPMEFSEYYGKKLTNKDYTFISEEILKAIYSIKSNRRNNGGNYNS